MWYPTEPRRFRSKETAIWYIQGGAGKQEVIYTLQEFSRVKVRTGEVLGQGMAKEMQTTAKALGENCLRKLSHSPCTRVLPGEGKEKVWVRV